MGIETAGAPASGRVTRDALAQSSDERLVQLYRQGDEMALATIFERYLEPLVRYCARYTSAARAEDVVQLAFERTLPALRDPDRRIEIRPWLYRVVKNLAINDLRDNSPGRLRTTTNEAIEFGIDSANASGVCRAPEEVVEERDMLRDLVGGVDRLPTRQRQAFVLREIEGLGFDEIAEYLDSNPTNARKLVQLARKRLREGFGMLVPLRIFVGWLWKGSGTATAIKACAVVAVAGTAVTCTEVALHSGTRGEHDPRLTTSARSRADDHASVDSRRTDAVADRRSVPTSTSVRDGTASVPVEPLDTEQRRRRPAPGIAPDGQVAKHQLADSGSASERATAAAPAETKAPELTARERQVAAHQRQTENGRRIAEEQKRLYRERTQRIAQRHEQIRERTQETQQRRREQSQQRQQAARDRQQQIQQAAEQRQQAAQQRQQQRQQAARDRQQQRGQTVAPAPSASG